MTTPAGSPPLLLYSSPGPVDALMIPDLPPGKTVREYSDWQQSDSQMYKDHVENRLCVKRCTSLL